MTSLIIEKDPKSPAAEAYRTLRTNIQFSSLDNQIKTIVITSAGPGEGKSTTACNLALTIAQTGKKVLLIDCDMRKPSVHKKFRISNKTGLSNLLIEGLKVEDVGIKVSSYMDVLTAGTIPPNPSEMLGSQKMKVFLRDMEEKYDHVIIDSPPVLAVTDAQILSTASEGVILVISSQEAPAEACKRAKDLLMAVNANIIGVVLNKVENKSGKRYGGYYYYYYGDGDNKEKRRKKSK